VAEQLTAQRISYLIERSRGTIEAFASQTIAKLAALKEARVRARQRVDVEAELAAVRHRVRTGELTAPAAVRAVREAEKRVLVRVAIGERTVALTEEQLLATFEADRLEAEIPTTFHAEIEAARPKLHDAVAAAVASFSAAIAMVPADVEDAETATRRGGLIGRGFVAASEAEQQLAQLWSLADRLREYGLLPDVEGSRADDWHWTEPSAVPGRRTFGMPLGRVEHLRRAIAAGAGPTLRTQSQVLEQLQRVAAAERAKRAAARLDGAHTRGIPREAVVATVRDIAEADRLAAALEE
jgi:hypothetical protein